MQEGMLPLRPKRTWRTSHDDDLDPDGYVTVLVLVDCQRLGTLWRAGPTAFWPLAASP
jgi:hypothetical protein